MSPALQVDYLPAEPQGKPKNAGEGSLSEALWMMQMRPWKCEQLTLLLNIYKRQFMHVIDSNETGHLSQNFKL